MNITLDFGNILTRAWNITWRHKVLWLFGILAGCGRGGGNSGGGGTSFQTDAPFPSDGQPPLPPEWQRFFESGDATLLLIALACLALLLFVVAIVLQTIGTGGLIGGIQMADSTGSITFGEAWGLGLSKFWRLLGLSLLVVVISIVAALVIILPGALLSALTFGIGLICFLPLLCVFIIAAILFSVVVTLAQVAAVVDDLPIFDALRRGWEVFRNNLGNVIIMALIIGVISIVIGIVIALPFLIVLAPIMLSVAGFANENQALGTTGIAFAVICFCLYLPVLLVLSGILTTWSTSAYTLTYKQLTRPAAPPAAAPDITPGTPPAFPA